jgi:outer membrane cobalamin receptor
MIVPLAAAVLRLVAPGPHEESLPVYTVPPVRVEAERIERERVFPGARTVLDRTWLHEHDPRDLGAALAGIPGVRVLDAGDGAGSMVAARGLGAERVAVLLDGRPLNLAQGGGVDLHPVDLEDVERIEVARGAVGALYGPGAVAGAVNLVRRDDRTDRLGARAIGGSAARAILRANAAASRGRWDAEVAARAETAAPDLDGARPRSKGGGFRARIAHHPGWAARLETRASWREDRRDVPGSRAFPSPGARRRDIAAEWGAGLGGLAVGAGVIDADLSFLRFRREYADPEAPLGAIDDAHENRRERFTAGWGTAGGTWSADARSELVRDGLESTTEGTVRRNRAGFSAAGHWTRPATAATAVARFDAVDGLAPEGSGRLAVERALHGRWRLRAGAGTAFRPPSFDDLFWPARATAAGNPDLRPERVHDLDAGIHGAAAGVGVEVSIFGSRVEDLIQWTPGADGVWRPHNVGRARVFGAEAAIALDLDALPLGLEASYSRLDARDATGDAVTGGTLLVGRASHRAGLEARYRAGAWTLTGAMRAVGRVPLTAANTKWQPGYVLWSAGVRRELAPRLTADLRVENLTGARYEDLRGYATRGREILGGLRYRWER